MKRICEPLLAPSSNINTTATAYLLLRVFIGLTMAFSHGMGKMPPSEMLIGGVSSLGFPMPEFFAWAAACAEVVGGLLLAVGLLTRPAAAFVCFTMLVAVVGVHGADPFEKKEMALLYLFSSLFFVLAGAGKFSLDQVLSRRCNK